MTAAADVIFLLDVDNTLLDADCVITDFKAFLQREIGAENCVDYWNVFDALRAEIGYVDYLAALQNYRVEHLNDSRLLQMSSFLLDYPFTERLYPDALAVISYLHSFGPTVILSDGDVVFQPRKIQRSGLWDAVEGRVLIYIHKEQMLDAIAQQYPAKRYVMVDDKLRILTAMKAGWGNRLTTVFPRQGHYAHDPAQTLPYPQADVTVERIGELLDYNFSTDFFRTGFPKISDRGHA